MTETKDWYLPTIRYDLCSSCGTCIELCPVQAVEMGEQGKPVIVRPKTCSYCGSCEEICPEGAIELVFEILAAPRQGE